MKHAPNTLVSFSVCILFHIQNMLYVNFCVLLTIKAQEFPQITKTSQKHNLLQLHNTASYEYTRQFSLFCSYKYCWNYTSL